MAEFYKLVNLTAREFIEPAAFNISGLHNLRAITAPDENAPGLGSAMTILMACPYPLGDLHYDKSKVQVLGRWFGHHVVMVGDYGMEQDMVQTGAVEPSDIRWKDVYRLCRENNKPLTPGMKWSQDYEDHHRFVDITEATVRSVSMALTWPVHIRKAGEHARAYQWADRPSRDKMVNRAAKPPFSQRM